MMSGVVNADLETILRLHVQATSGSPYEVETVLDTGFTGFLTLPSALIAVLGLMFLYRQLGQLADGSFVNCDVYEGTVLWDGQPRTVEVEALDAQPLLGTAILENHEVRIPVVIGGVAPITAIP